LKDRLNDVDSEKQKDVLNQQISNSNNFIKKIDSNINSNQSKLSLAERNYADKKRDFDEQMKIEEQRIKELSTSN
jgi:flagellar biosynthesis chaperone FliJ